MPDNRGQYSVDLRSKASKPDVLASDSFVISIAADVPAVPLLMASQQKIVALALVVGFFISPFGWVFADEVAPPTDTPPPAEAPAPEPEIAPPEAETAPVAEEMEPEESFEAATEDTNETPEGAPSEAVSESDEEDVEDTVDAAETEPLEEEAEADKAATSTPEEIAIAAESASSTPASVSGGSTDSASSTPESDENAETDTESATTTDEAVDESATTTPDEASDENAEASVSQEEAEELEEAEDTEPAEVVTYTDNDSRQVFRATDCVMVREGEFYCIRPDAPVATSSPSVADVGSAAFVRKDTSGDKEIFWRGNGSVVQVTNNDVDDDAPIFDAESNTLVWHSLVNDRYQVMSYNALTGETRQITNTSYNNTNPYVQGGILVWQGWPDNSWEIFIMQNGVQSRLTQNSYHDMFPKVYKQFVTWQAREGDTWQSYMYDTVSGKTSEIGEGEGGFESPRFVLMVERRNENGDIERIGYDVNTGESIPLGVTPKQTPADEPVVPDDPLKEQKSVMPTTQGTTTPKVSSEDDDGDTGE
jgi:hypothetical protein